MRITKFIEKFVVRHGSILLPERQGERHINSFEKYGTDG